MSPVEVTQVVEHHYDFGRPIDFLVFELTVAVAVIAFSLVRYLWWLMEDGDDAE